MLSTTIFYYEYASINNWPSQFKRRSTIPIGSTMDLYWTNHYCSYPIMASSNINF